MNIPLEIELYNRFMRNSTLEIVANMDILHAVLTWTCNISWTCSFDMDM